jgi:prepilin-type N-terminal cleavage/methylation domain-containing protein
MVTRKDPADAGFTLVEVLASLAVIGVVMTAVTTFFVRSMISVDLQGARQAAIQVASDQMEHLREMPGSAAVGWVLDPVNSQPKTVGGTVYTVAWSCTVIDAASPAPGRPCGATDSLVPPVVKVTWNDKGCPSGVCQYSTTTLISTAEIEPLFDPAAL